jgi:hypothetical protein
VEVGKEMGDRTGKSRVKERRGEAGENSSLPCGGRTAEGGVPYDHDILSVFGSLCGLASF